MAPAYIIPLLHYYFTFEPYAEPNQTPERASAIIRTENELVSMQLLKRRMEPTDLGSQYEITDRGRAYVEALTSIPLPVIKWVIPEGRDAS